MHEFKGKVDWRGRVNFNAVLAKPHNVHFVHGSWFRKTSQVQVDNLFLDMFPQIREKHNAA